MTFVYAGTQTTAPTVVAATIQASSSRVRDGHAAGWVGVRTSKGWVQVGVQQTTGRPRLYVEWRTDGKVAQRFVPGDPGLAHPLKVERRGPRWVAFIDGVRVAAVKLRGAVMGFVGGEAYGHAWFWYVFTGVRAGWVFADRGAHARSANGRLVVWR